MGLLSKKAQQVVGVDVSSSAVKLLELSKHGSKYRVEAYAVEPLPPNAVVEKNITEVEAVGEAIRRAVKRAQTKNKYSSVAVAGSAVITKVISMPANISDAEMANYAKASVLSGLLKAEGNSLMTERGNVSVDDRTNTLLVRDTTEAITAIRRLVSKLDTPVRQVLIESRIVIADDTFNRDLGVRFGVSKAGGSDLDGVADADGSIDQNFTGGGLAGNTTFASPVAFNQGGVENLLVDLPIGGPAGAIQFAVVAIPDFLLQLELQALQMEGRGEVLSNPRVVTSDQTEALIEQGTQIPFQEASSSGATSTSFQSAVLSLRVTPQITPDDRVIMDLSVNQDQVGQEFSGVPSVNTRQVTTQVLVDDGDTVVLGGIYEQNTRLDVEKVPFFGDLPYVGWLFKTTSARDDRTELLIFVTPKILKEVLSTR